jgi:hypothetical protein
LEDPHWPLDILELPFASILEGDIELAPYRPVRVIRDANPARLRQSLQTRCHIHAVAENVTSIDNDVSNIDADAELNTLLIWYLGIAPGHPSLNVKSAAHCVHHASKLGQQSISGMLDDPAAMFGNLGVDNGAEMVLKLGVGALLVHAGQPAVAGHIRGQYCSKSAFDAVLTRDGRCADLRTSYTPNCYAWMDRPARRPPPELRSAKSLILGMSGCGRYCLQSGFSDGSINATSETSEVVKHHTANLAE